MARVVFVFLCAVCIIVTANAKPVFDDLEEKPFSPEPWKYDRFERIDEPRHQLEPRDDFYNQADRHLETPPEPKNGRESYARRGPPNNRGPPDNRGPPANRGPPGNRGPPDNRGPPGNRGPPDNRGPPNNKGPPNNRGPGNSGSPGNKGPPGNGPSYNNEFDEREPVKPVEIVNEQQLTTQATVIGNSSDRFGQSPSSIPPDMMFQFVAITPEE